MDSKVETIDYDWLNEQFGQVPSPLPVAIDSDPGLLITSHSIDATFDACPRRFEFLHSYLRAPDRESDAWAADVGTAIHEAAQAWQRALFYKRPVNESEQIGQIQLLRFWPWETEDRRMLKNPESGRIAGVGIRTLGNSLLLLQQIYESTIWNEWELVSIEGFGPAIEVPWRIIHRSLGEIELPYGRKGFIATQGKIDFIVRHRGTGKYKPIDLKTTAKEKPAHDASFRFSGQVGQYAMVLDQALGLDWEKNGLDVTYLLAPFDETLGVYPLNYNLSPDDIQDLIHAKLERLYRMREYAQQKYWPRRTHGCEFYGNPCGFLDICHRRDQKYIEDWFEFEKISGRFRNYDRIYDPVWTLEA